MSTDELAVVARCSTIACAGDTLKPNHSRRLGGSMTLPHDADEIGYSTRLLFALPLLRTLVQAVAESEGADNNLIVTLVSGARLRVARSAGRDELTISSDDGTETGGASSGPTSESLVAHGFIASRDRSSYELKMGFESDGSFEDAARLIIGTFQHAWGASLREFVHVDLSLSLPRPGADA